MLFIYGDFKNETKRETCYCTASSCSQTQDQIHSTEINQTPLNLHKLYLLFYTLDWYLKKDGLTFNNNM